MHAWCDRCKAIAAIGIEISMPAVAAWENSFSRWMNCSHETKPSAFECLSCEFEEYYQTWSFRILSCIHYLALLSNFCNIFESVITSSETSKSKSDRCVKCLPLFWINLRSAHLMKLAEWNECLCTTSSPIQFKYRTWVGRSTNTLLSPNWFNKFFNWHFYLCRGIETLLTVFIILTEVTCGAQEIFVEIKEIVIQQIHSRQWAQTTQTKR